MALAIAVPPPSLSLTLTMNGTREDSGQNLAHLTPKTRTRLRTRAIEFINVEAPIERTQRLADSLLAHDSFLQVIKAIPPELQIKFVDKVYSVRDPYSKTVTLCRCSTKINPTIDLRSVKRLTSLGEICSAIGRPPTAVFISDGLEKHGTHAFAAGGLTDVWKGELDRKLVSAKTFRPYPDASMTDAKKVQLKRAKETRVFDFDTNAAGPVETSADLDNA